jgi:dolichol-phosphate mannosyltransferase
MINNFIWNERWTFKKYSPAVLSLSAARGVSQGGVESPHEGIFRRFLLFNAICGIGIGVAVLLLHLFHTWLGWNLYVSNLLAIILVTIWNFGMNVQLNWRRKTIDTRH